MPCALLMLRLRVSRFALVRLLLLAITSNWAWTSAGSLTTNRLRIASETSLFTVRMSPAVWIFG
ncbi:hypothetical protein X551_03656 [Methylibium sp. T29]|nr:hypothetical protein X551_03656 [Methylibium sp. T29]EWS59365.1 hypothetical protein Y694_02823 [Methylibium sp. T29-B]